MRRLGIAKQHFAEEGKRKEISLEKLTLLNAIEEIVELSAGSKLEDDFFCKAKRYIAFVAERLALTPTQVVLLSVFVDKSNDSSIQMDDFSSHFGCRLVRMIRYMADIDELEKRKFVYCSRGKRITYRVPLELVMALKQDKCYVPKDNRNISCGELFLVLEILFQQRRDDEELTYDQLLEEIRSLFSVNRHLSFVRKIQNLPLEEEDWILFVYFCHLFVNNDDNRIGAHDFDGLYENRFIFKRQTKLLVNGDSELLTSKLVEYVNEDGFANRDTYKLTEEAKRDFLGELDIEIKPRGEEKGLLQHENLAKKTLYYNERERGQVERLAALLQPESFKEIRERLRRHGMRNGFACLFYGLPGTGKTETVYQLAKRTGRNIMQVNVTEVKSMWVGESEKNIKALFDRYRALVNQLEVAPILLFNEADAIIGKRQEGAERAVDKMENSIQNIILQEMENLDGILIATTNLTQNMDKAFERRFLYKIEFGRPNTDAKQAIWQSMIPSLKPEEARELALAYEFSGGQIENVARKLMVDTILTGVEADVQELKQYCDEEVITTTEKRKKIGFSI